MTSFRQDVTLLRQEIRGLRDEMRNTFATKADLYEVRDELKRHTLVLYESLNDNIRLLAEAVVTNNARSQED
jgi:hypothetical protein